MLKSKVFDQELYNNTSMPLVKHMCEQIKNNGEFSGFLTKYQQEILDDYHVILTIQYDYFYLKNVMEKEYIYIYFAYDYELNVIYVCEFAKQ